MNYDVTVNREVYIGGSDIPAIMGISPFTTRWELLLEKSGLKEREFCGNVYTVYGQKLEPQIRNHINNLYNTNYEPNRIVQGDIRCHTDGFNGESVLEIKTTSKVHSSIEEYKIYLVQLLLYMQLNNVENGMLAVYERPKDFDESFNENRLSIFTVEISDYKDLLDEINYEINRFRDDLARLKENPLLTQEDFVPSEITTLAKQVMILEAKLELYKNIEAEYKTVKEALYKSMNEHNIKSWETYNGTKITKVDGSKASEKQVVEFDEKAFKAENPALYEMYCIEKIKKTAGRKGYVKITLPK